MPFPFNVRVYGVLVQNLNVLVTDEVVQGSFYTKFPGGGLEFGEGTRECLRREFLEETGLEIEVGEHLYTTDFFVPSAFQPNQQVISIYYRVSCGDLKKLPLLRKQKFDFNKGEIQIFRWIEIAKLSIDDFELPIDKKLVEIIRGSVL